MTEPDLPTRLYHITPVENLPSILNEGLTCGWGNFASSTLENAARFLALRAMSNPDQKWVAVEIGNTDKLGFEISADHMPEFFGTDDSWVTMRPIHPENFLNWYEVTFGPRTPELVEEKQA